MLYTFYMQHTKIYPLIFNYIQYLFFKSAMDTMEYNLAIKISKQLWFATWTNLKIIMVSERSQTKKTNALKFLYVKFLKIQANL